MLSGTILRPSRKQSLKGKLEQLNGIQFFFLAFQSMPKYTLPEGAEQRLAAAAGHGHPGLARRFSGFAPFVGPGGPGGFGPGARTMSSTDILGGGGGGMMMAGGSSQDEEGINSSDEEVGYHWLHFTF